MPGMAAADAAKTFPETAHWAVQLDRLDEVLAATGIEAAHRRENRP